MLANSIMETPPMLLTVLPGIATCYNPRLVNIIVDTPSNIVDSFPELRPRTNLKHCFMVVFPGIATFVG